VFRCINEEEQGIAINDLSQGVTIYEKNHFINYENAFLKEVNESYVFARMNTKGSTPIIKLKESTTVI